MNIGIIGFGYWGPNLVRNFSQMQDVNLKYLCDLYPENLARAKLMYRGVATTDDYRDILRDPSVDAIVIATPVSSHYRLAMDAIEAGKHVLLEKPMASTVAECSEIIIAAERKNLVLQIDHTYVYTGAIRKMKEIVDSNDLGKILYFDSVRINLGLFQHDVNVIWDLAPHDLSIMDYILSDRCLAVSGTGVSNFEGNHENIAYATMFLESGAIAHIHVNWISPVKVRRIIIGGDKKMLIFDELEPSDKLKVYDKGVDIKNGDSDELRKTLVQYRTGDMWAPKIDQTEALSYECRHFVDCIKEGKKPITDGEMGLRVVRLLEAINTSIASEGMKVAVCPQRV